MAQIPMAIKIEFNDEQIQELKDYIAECFANLEIKIDEELKNADYRKLFNKKSLL